MNITIVTNILPWPLTSGGAQAQFNIINALRKSHKFTLIFTQDGRNTVKAMNELRKIWPEVDIIPFMYWRQLCYPQFFKDKVERALKLKFIPENVRFQVERTLKPYGVYFSNDFVRFLKKHIVSSKADLVEVNFFPCLPTARFLSLPVKKVFVHHELRYIRNERLLKNFKLTEKEKALQERVKQEEIANLNCYDAVITLTDTDAGILKQTGVDVPLYVSPAAVNAEVLPYSPWNGKIVFVGGFGHIPNQEGMEWFVKNVADKLTCNYKSIDIVGLGWPSSFDDNDRRIHRLGFVEKLADAVKGSIMIVPILTGSGMRMKILESAAMSVPFVTTSVGVEGLDFKNNESCLLADNAGLFAASIDRLANDPNLYKQLAEGASKVFGSLYSVEALSLKRENVYKQICQPKE